MAFRCDDDKCKGHEMSILDWEIDALYHRLIAEHLVPDIAADHVVEMIQERMLAPSIDARLYLGNLSSHPQSFTIVGLWYANAAKTPSTQQARLF
jgi:hypothetical protein